MNTHPSAASAGAPEATVPTRKTVRGASRWPLLLLALPAGVATWSGWVGLGEMTGFGPVQPLPGIADWEINTAITLPIGVEAYAAYALRAWLSHDQRIDGATRAFARWSAIGSLILGMLGQVAYHLLEVAGHKEAPWQVVVAVACLPVLVLGMGAALGHMLSRDAHAEESEPVGDQVAHTSDPDGPDDPLPQPVPEPAPTPRASVTRLPVVGDADLLRGAAERYSALLESGQAPSVETIKRDLRVGQPRAQRVRDYLKGLTGQQVVSAG